MKIIQNTIYLMRLYEVVEVCVLLLEAAVNNSLRKHLGSPGLPGDVHNLSPLAHTHKIH